MISINLLNNRLRMRYPVFQNKLEITEIWLVQVTRPPLSLRRLLLSSQLPLGFKLASRLLLGSSRRRRNLCLAPLLVSLLATKLPRPQILHVTPSVVRLEQEPCHLPTILSCHKLHMLPTFLRNLHNLFNNWMRMRNSRSPWQLPPPPPTLPTSFAATCSSQRARSSF